MNRKGKKPNQIQKTAQQLLQEGSKPLGQHDKKRVDDQMGKGEVEIPGRKRPALGNITNATHNIRGKKPHKDGIKKERKADIQTVEEAPVQEECMRQESAMEVESECIEMQASPNDITQISVIPQSLLQQSSLQNSPQDAVMHSPPLSNPDLYSLEVTPIAADSGVYDFDRDVAKDLNHIPEYAAGIFKYYKSRETKFVIPSYFHKQLGLTPAMRAILVDWMVEVQENFELNHETLYLGIKITDTYLSLKQVEKEDVQLVGAVSLFIASKYDERLPPLIDDFLYICDGAYDKQTFITSEREIFRTIGYDVGMPLSYRFLRRYSKCSRSTIETLTLARYILETSLMIHSFISHRDSLMAAAALYLAFRMKQEGTWDKNMVHHTGYTEHEIRPLAKKLNCMLASPPYKQLVTIQSKYSHSVFHGVAKIPALSDSDWDDV